jgi:hypothetical protein
LQDSESCGLQSQQTNECILGDGPSSAKHPRTLPVVGAAAAVSLTETRILLAELKLTGKVKVWQTSYIQKYRNNY